MFALIRFERRSLLLLSSTVALGLALAACATSTKTNLVDVVKRKASFDLACEELRVG